MQKVRYTLSFICIFLFHTLLLAYEGTVNVFYYNEFLPSNYISSIVQDRRGVIYFASSDWISCFDGYSIKSLPKPSQTGNKRPIITRLLFDGASDLWIATLQGLYYYDVQTQAYQYILFHQNDILHKSNIIYDITEDKNHTLFFATRNGIYSLRGKDAEPKRLKFFAYHENVDLKNKSERIALCLAFDKNGRLWVGTEGNGIAVINLRDGRTVYYNKKSDLGIPSDIITSIHEDLLGNIWVGTDKGVCVYNPSMRQFQKQSFVSSYVNAITSDKLGNVFLATTTGLYVYDQNTRQLTNYRNNPFDKRSLCSDVVKCVFRDRSDALWIGTQRGISLYESQPEFILYQHITSDPSSLPFNRVHFLAADESVHRLYIGGSDQHLAVRFLDKNQFKNLCDVSSHPDISSYGQFLCGKVQKNHQLLIGTESGLLQYDEKMGLQPFALNYLLPESANVYAIETDLKQNLYLAILDKGFFYLDCGSKKLQHIPLVEKKKHFEIFSNIKILHRDRNDRIWVVFHQGGLLCYDPTNGSISHYMVESQPQLLSNTIWSLLETTKHQLLIGTVEGVAVYDLDQKRFVSQPAFDPLRDFEIFGIQEDTVNQSFWFSTDKGVVRIQPSTGDLVLFSEKDRLQGDSFNYQSSAVYRSSLFLGGDNGLNEVNIHRIMDSSVLPVPSIVSVKVGNRTLKLEPISQKQTPLTIRLRHNELLEIGLSAFSYQKMWRNSFRYQIVGVDTTYQYLLKENHLIQRMYLPRGHFRLMVSASNCAGVWSTPQQLAWVDVRADLFWLYFILLAVVLVLFFYGVWHWIRSKRSEKNMQMNKLSTTDRTEALKPEPIHDVISTDIGPKILPTDERNSVLLARLDEIMDNERPYLNKRFSKTQLAGMMKISETQLSQLLKDCKGKGYNDYINEYRVNYFKYMIRSNEYKDYKLLSIGIECGFNSKTSFYRVFKSMTGMTPSEYIEQQESKK